MVIDMFLGESIGFWIEIKKKIDADEDYMEIKLLIEENCNLRAKVSYYEDRIKALNSFMESKK